MFRSASASRLLWLLLLISLALTLRTWGLRELVYVNSDEALWSYFVVTTAQLSPVAPEPSQNALAKLLSWDYGYPLFLALTVHVRALEILGLPVSEATLPLPLILLGTLCVPLTYRLARLLTIIAPKAPDTTTGSDLAPLLAAGLVAVMPILVGRHRSMGAAEAATGFLFLLTVICLIRYWQVPAAPRRSWLAGLVLGLWICSDVQFVVGGAALIAFLLLWPRTDGYDGWTGLRRLLLQPGLLLPPFVLFAPYVPAYLYAAHLGYPDQTFLGTMLHGKQPDWGLHLIPFLREVWMNVGLFPLAVLPIALGLILTRRRHDPRHQWALLWLFIASLPFLVAVTSKVTESHGYQHHVATALALVVALGLAALHDQRPTLPRPGPALPATVALLLVLATGAVTLGGVFRVPALLPLWPSPKIPYGGLAPNSGMKTAGCWVRQNLPPEAVVFVAHDPAVAYWYLGRAALTGGYTSQDARKQTFLDHLNQVQSSPLAAAVIPGQRHRYPPDQMQAYGFPGRLRVLSGDQEVLTIYTRNDRDQILRTEQLDPLYNQTYRTARAIIPPPFPYVPGKTLGLR